MYTYVSKFQNLLKLLIKVKEISPIYVDLMSGIISGRESSSRMTSVMPASHRTKVRKSIGFPSKESIWISELGFVHLNSDFWDHLYSEYLSKSLRQISIDNGNLSIATIKSYFNRRGFPLKSKEELRSSISFLTKNALNTKYGVNSPQQLKSVSDKRIKTNMKRYGGKSPASSSKILSKMIRTSLSLSYDRLYSSLKAYNFTILSLKDDYKGERYYDSDSILRDFKYSLRCDSCGFSFSQGIFRIPTCPNCSDSSSTFISSGEKRILSFIRGMGIECSSNYKRFVSSGIAELDIYIPSKNIAIEYNGFLTHCSGHNGLVSPFRKEEMILPKSRSYHRDKTTLCLDGGISLYHIWQGDPLHIIYSKLRVILGDNSNITRVFARKCSFRKISISESSLFFNKYHLHGNASSSKDFIFGLFLGDELISCISFRRYSKSSIEIARFATKLDTIVVGGFSKLLNNVLLLLRGNFKSIITYAYSDWTPDYRNSVYYKYGFSYLELTSPSLFYWKKGSDTRVHRQKYQKHKLKKLFPESFNPNLTANQILSKESIYPIYDSGNHKFIYRIL